MEPVSHCLSYGTGKREHSDHVLGPATSAGKWGSLLLLTSYWQKPDVKMGIYSSSGKDSRSVCKGVVSGTTENRVQIQALPLSS